MPGKDGKGPGQGGQSGRRGQGQGRGNAGLGPGGQCICPQCGTTSAHNPGTPCSTQKCPQCGASMIRQ